MKTEKMCILSTLLLSLVVTKAFAYEFSAENADGVTIYYNYCNNGNELEVTLKVDKSPHYSSYTGNIIIPEEVTFMGRTRKVTSIGADAFNRCKGLTSVTIPKNVTKIGQMAFYQCNELTSITIPQDVTYIDTWAFSGCNGLTSITIPQKVTHIGDWAFDCDNLTTVISLIDNPFDIPGADTYSHVFSNNTFYNAILYVPYGTIEKYKSTKGWKDFYFIEEGNGGVIPSGNEKCATPTIMYHNGKLTFNCDTKGAICHSTITDDDVMSFDGNEVQLGVTYNISVYAAKEGYQNSETTTATLCWIDVEPKTEGITDGMARMAARAIMVKAEGGQLTVEGAEDNTNIAVYSIDGVQVGTTTSRNGVASILSAIPKDSVAIVRIGNKSVKVMMK